MRSMMTPVLVAILSSATVATATPRKQPSSDSDKAKRNEAFEWLRNAFMRSPFYATYPPVGESKEAMRTSTQPLRFEQPRECLVLMEAEFVTSGPINLRTISLIEADFSALNPNVIVKKIRQAATKDGPERVVYTVVAYTYQLRPSIKVTTTRVVEQDTKEKPSESRESAIYFSFREEDLVDRTARALRIAIEGCGGKTEGF